MRADITADEIDFYRTNGFVVIPDFLDATELATWRSAVDAAVAERVARFSHPGGGDQPVDDPDRSYYDRVFVQRVNLWQTNEAVRPLILDEHLGRIATELAGVDGLRVWHDQALVKPAYGNPTAWHLDVPYWSFTSPDAITVWVALDDATAQNGALCYLPGSHLARKFDNVGIGDHIGALFDVYPEWRDIEPAVCAVPAGGAVFHNGLTAHGAGANMTPRPRRAMTCAYMPDGARFNGIINVLPPSMLARLEPGDLLDDEGQNPLVYSRPVPATLGS